MAAESGRKIEGTSGQLDFRVLTSNLHHSIQLL